MIALALALVAALAAAPEVAVVVAPDQPAPHIYTGDPLIIEFRANRDCTVGVKVAIRPEFGGDSIEAVLGDIKLQADGPQWRTIDGVPDTRGRYFITTRVESGEGVAESSGVFCRIDRPGAAAGQLPVCAVVENLGTRQRLALRTAGVRAVRIDASDDTVRAKTEAALDAQFQVMVRVRVRQGAPELCESLAREWHDRIYCWQLDPGGSVESFAAMAKSLRAGGTRSPIALVVSDAEIVKSMLAAGLGKTIDAFAVDPAPSGEAMRLVRAAAERAGYERIDLQACLPALDAQQAGFGARVARDGLDLVAAGASLVVFDGALVAGESLGPAFVYLDALAHRLAGASYIGRLPQAGASVAHVFRGGDEWVAVLWCASGEGDAVIPVENAGQLELYDGRNNPLPCPPPAAGALTVRVGPEPVFLAGKGGPLIESAALAEARKEAAAFCASEDTGKYIAKEAVDAIRKFAGDEPRKRVDFLNLLQAFPYLEKQWHSGPVPRSAAVPALACLARLARALCVVEHERGEPFIEPLQSTLAACGQFQSLYLTGSAGPGDGHERPDWLLDEVSRLMAEAEALAAEGRGVEAGAVAALAEWRAQALELAAKAEPLSAPEKEKAAPEIKQVEKKEEPKLAEPGKKAVTKKSSRKK